MCVCMLSLYMGVLQVGQSLSRLAWQSHSRDCCSKVEPAFMYINCKLVCICITSSSPFNLNKPILTAVSLNTRANSLCSVSLVRWVLQKQVWLMSLKLVLFDTAVTFWLWEFIERLGRVAVKSVVSSVSLIGLIRYKSAALPHWIRQSPPISQCRRIKRLHYFKSDKDNTQNMNMKTQLTCLYVQSHSSHYFYWFILPLRSMNFTIFATSWAKKHWKVCTKTTVTVIYFLSNLRVLNLMLPSDEPFSMHFLFPEFWLFHQLQWRCTKMYIFTASSPRNNYITVIGITLSVYIWTCEFWFKEDWKNVNLSSNVVICIV